MKFTFILILIFSFLETSFGQKYPQTLVDSFCNVTIKYYYNDFTKPRDSVAALSYKHRNPYILNNDLTRNLKTQFLNFSVNYVTQEEALEEIARTKSRSGSLEEISVSQNQDTINVDIAGWSIQVTKVKRRKGILYPVRSSFSASCGGTLGYIPTCRFVYDNKTKSWTKYTWQEIADEKMRGKQNADGG